MNILHTLKRIIRPILKDSTLDSVTVSDDGFTLPRILLESLIDLSAKKEIRLYISQVHRPRDMVLPLVDLLTLASICRARSPQRIMEIGTYTGESTFTMAMNSGEDCEIFTLDLPLDEVPPMGRGGYEIGKDFIGTQEASRIRQLHGRSETFDFSPYYGTMDLVFVDADHSFDAVKNDTLKALKLVRNGGLIIWDDYRYLPCHIGCRGVADYLHSVAHEIPIYQIEGTRLAVLENHQNPGVYSETN